MGAAACGGGGGDGSTGPTGGGAPTIALSASSLTISGLGATQSLSARVTPSTAAVAWSSTNPAVATVAGAGATATITAVAGGSTQITATATSGSRTTSATATVTVTPAVRSIQLAEANLQLTAGTSQRLTPTVTADAGAVRTLQWRSDDVAIATVDSAGVVTAVAPGATTVRASAVATPTVSAAVAVRVTALPRVRSVAVTPAVDSAFVGQARTFTATVTADSGLATTAFWRSSAPAVATVDGAGRVTTLAAGSTTLTAIATADTTVRATATLTVRIPTVRSVSLAVPTSLVAGRAVDATATVVSDPGADARLSWTSSATAVATVDGNGRVTALAAGTTTITVRSVAFTAVSASAVLTVTVPPTTSVFTEVAVGSGGGLSTARITDIFATSPTQGIVFADASAPNIAGVSAPLQMGSPAFQERSDLLAPFTGRFGGDADGSSPSDVFWSLPNDRFSFFTNTAFVLRWNGSTLVSTNWPLPSGTTSPFASALSSIGVGEVLALSSTGGILRYRGGAWTTLVSTSTTTSGSGMSAWTADSAVITRCREFSSSEPRVAIFRAGTVTPLANTTLGDDPAFVGCGRSPIALAGGDFLVALDRVVARYSGGTFTPYTPTLGTGERYNELALCGSTLYAGTSLGRIFRASGTVLSPIADVGLAAVGSTRSMSCAPDGTLRVGSDNGLVSRWSGGTWTDEHYAPSLGGVSLQSADAGLAVGSNGSIWRWNGSQWNWLRRNSADLLVRSYLAPDGTMFAGGSFFSGAQTGLILRSNGGGWVRTELSPNEAVRALWGTSSSFVFAIASPLSGPGRIIRFDGTTWSTAVNASTALESLHGSSATHAIAAGVNGVALRWDGSSWTAMPSIPVGSSSVSITELLTFSPTLAYAGAGRGCDSFTPGGLWRWNGSAWVDAGLTAAGFSNCVSALFGTGPNDVFAVVTLPFSGGSRPPDRLVRWNGTAWSLVPLTLANDYTNGAAIPGFTVLAGRRGRVLLGTVPGAAGVRGTGATLLRRKPGS